MSQEFARQGAKFPDEGAGPLVKKKLHGLMEVIAQPMRVWGRALAGELGAKPPEAPKNQYSEA